MRQKAANPAFTLVHISAKHVDDIVDHASIAEYYLRITSLSEDRIFILQNILMCAYCRADAFA